MSQYVRIDYMSVMCKSGQIKLFLYCQILDCMSLLCRYLIDIIALCCQKTPLPLVGKRKQTRLDHYAWQVVEFAINIQDVPYDVQLVFTLFDMSGS